MHDFHGKRQYQNGATIMFKNHRMSSVDPSVIREDSIIKFYCEHWYVLFDKVCILKQMSIVSLILVKNNPIHKHGMLLLYFVWSYFHEITSTNCIFSHSCKSQTVYKILCRDILVNSFNGLFAINDHKQCNTWNHIDTKICRVCKNRIQVVESLEFVQLKEEQRLNRTFLKACNNSYSERHNLHLLFYGYIHSEIKDMNLYQYIPKDIIALIVMFSYNMDRIVRPIGDKFNVELKNRKSVRNWLQRFGYNNYAKWFNNNTILKWKMPRECQHDHIFKVYGCFKITGKCVRKIWKIKILDINEADKIDLRIGLTDCMSGITMKFNECNHDKIKVGDIITMIYFSRYVSNNNRASVLFELNGVNIFESHCDLRGFQLQLVISFDCDLSIQLLQH